ncbi:serine/threonine protein kinase-like protein [Phanerochaete sordida]|uniref:non-specific serine/threonine protein kinase n=1 Tax=Phanerochaete sordida TaxID=48140 RepID=A0A9P3G2X1_9APHY|nr:serine/threonine protein kinase-like protein [Phanerochaete sordida]
MPHNVKSMAVTGLECRVVDDGRIQLLDCLGHGTFGAVYRARDLREKSSAILAVKVMHLRAAELCKREVRYQALVHSHPHIVTVKTWWEDADYTYTVLDYCAGGDLWKAIHVKRLFWRRGDLLKRAFVQIVDALAHCHEQGVYHRDLKPANILISSDSQDVFLADFGLATGKTQSTSYHVGTQNYRSPECNDINGEGRPYSLRRNDIWAVGVILVHMLAGTGPWSHATLENDYYQSYLCSPDFLRYTLPISKEAAYVCQRIFTENEEDSISLEELRELVLGVEEWWMSEEEIAASEEHLQKVASHYRRSDEPSTVYEDFSSSDDSDFNSLEDDSDDSDEHSNGLHSASLLAVEEGRMEMAKARQLVHAPLGSTMSSSTSSSLAPVTPAIPDICVEPASQPAKTNISTVDVPSCKKSLSTSTSSSSYYTVSGSSSMASGASTSAAGFAGKKGLRGSSRLGVRRHLKRLFSVAA